MNTNYQILNHLLCFTDLSAEHQYVLKKFAAANWSNPDIFLDCADDTSFAGISYKKNLVDVYGIQYCSPEVLHRTFFSQKDPKQFLYTEKADYSELHLRFQKDCSDICFMELLMAGFYSYISLKDALLMHASAVSYQDQAIVFTAASGTGKTTQAELWQKYREAVILNGDKVFLKQETDGIHAWGSPWKGSSPYSENKSAVLNAIIVLEQAEENAIRKLSGLETLEKVIPHIFLPQWDRKCENAVLNFLDQVLRTTDIYFLQCRPDEEAVALVERTLFNPS